MVSGETRDYESALLRRSFRKPDGTVGKQTVANLSMLPPAAVDAIEAVLKGKTLIEADAAVQVSRSLPHGHVALVCAGAARLGLPALLGAACRERDLAYALIVSRVLRPTPKLSTLAWWNDVTLGPDLGVAGASRNEVYAAMDWLLGRQDTIEASLARRHLSEGGRAMFDLSSSWMETSRCELAARGYSRDGKKGKLQIEYGLLTDPDGRPVAIRVFPGNTADPISFTEAVEVVRGKFGLGQLTLVGDRGMITSARIAALKDLGGLSWITCLRAPAIAKLAAEQGPLQMSLFDQQDLAEISHPDYPGERLIACRNPLLATQRARTRDALLAATETALVPIVTAVTEGRLAGADAIGIKVGKLINRYKMAKHFDTAITDTSLTLTRRADQIAAEAALDGIYVIRTSVPATTLDAPATVDAYKNLAHLERDFRSIKADDLDLRPIHHYLPDRVRAHVLICMLACYLTWHLRITLAELTYTDEHPPARDNPVGPATRSASADHKASRHTSPDGQPLHSFRGLLEHMATLTRNTITITLAQTTFDKITLPTPTQHRAFELIGAPIPLTLR
ncbi:MAG TPA: IS1634 family transposase [Pseudonocardiaceae bacterium]|nr:IS1634 family transposase [Pseudonocardiaceae bacterium]